MDTSSKEFTDTALKEIVRHKDFHNLQRKYRAKDCPDTNDSMIDKADYTEKEIRKWVNVWYSHLALQGQ